MKAFVVVSSHKCIDELKQDLNLKELDKYFKYYDPCSWNNRHSDLINREPIVLFVPYGGSLKRKTALKELKSFYPEIYLIQGPKKAYYKQLIRKKMTSLYESI